MNRLIKQLRDIISDVLARVGAKLYSPEAVEILLKTGFVESGYTALKQYPSGPACSYWQVEPKTAEDIFSNYLLYRPEKRTAIVKACNIPEVYTVKLPSEAECHELLVTNIAFAICMARLVYYRIPKPLPSSGKNKAQAEYWLKYYNAGGKGSIEKFLASNEIMES